MLTSPPDTQIEITIPRRVTALIRECLMDRRRTVHDDFGHTHTDRLRQPATFDALIMQIATGGERDAVLAGPAELLWSATYDATCRRTEQLSETVDRLWRSTSIDQARRAQTAVNVVFDLLDEIERAASQKGDR